MKSNYVRLMGNLGNDPETRYTNSGCGVTNFSLATNSRWTSSQGEKMESTEWHKVVLWGKLAEVYGPHLSKGRRVLLEGKLKTRTWEDRDGNKRYTTEVHASNVEFLDQPKKRQESELSQEAKEIFGVS